MYLGNGDIASKRATENESRASCHVTTCINIWAFLLDKIGLSCESSRSDFLLNYRHMQLTNVLKKSKEVLQFLRVSFNSPMQFQEEVEFLFWSS